MRKELDDKLCATYPKLFRDRHANMQVTNMCWGFDCGDGWYDLIDELCAAIQTYSDTHFKEIGQPIASQVKEKFGTLRFYMEGYDNHIDTLIHNAYVKSSTTCDVCGQPGRLSVSTGLFATRCEAHTEKDAVLCKEV